jgi:hypothetical protein
MTTVFSNNIEQSISYSKFAIIIVCNKLLSIVKGLLRNIAHIVDKVWQHNNGRTDDLLCPSCKHANLLFSC